MLIGVKISRLAPNFCFIITLAFESLLYFCVFKKMCMKNIFNSPCYLKHFVDLRNVLRFKKTKQIQYQHTDW